MVDLAIGAAISSLKAAGEIAGSFLKLRDLATVQAKVIELQSTILAAQQSALAAQSDQFALLEEKRGLESKIADLEAWDREKQRYALTPLSRGRFAYALKDEARDGEPPHMLCPNCYQHRTKAILQEHWVDGQTIQHCPNCNTEIGATWSGFDES